jgi:GTP cyclohydrolase I
MEIISSNSQVDKYYLTWEDISLKAIELSGLVSSQLGIQYDTYRIYKIYGVPRGGIYPAIMVDKRISANTRLVTTPEEADIFIDDIIDSGATRNKFEKDFPGVPFLALYDKAKGEVPGWLVFPWEEMVLETGPQENVTRIIEYIGEDSEREGLRETPGRVVRSWDTLYGGYKVDPKTALKIFGEDSSDEIVLLKDIEFYSTCEHHMLPFFGKAHIAYIPQGKVVGISKLARILEVFSRRLQIQERLCQQITKLLDEELAPLGSACILEAQHFCMTARGVQKQNSIMVTSSLTGVFKNKDASRAELFQMIK